MLWARAAEILASEGRNEEAAEVHFRLGNLHYRLGNRDEAGRCYDASTCLAPQASTLACARIQNACGALLLSRGDPSGALRVFRDAAELRARHGARREEAVSRHNIAHCLHELRRLQEAEREYKRVIAIRREIGAAADRAGSESNLAWILLDSGRVEEALGRATEALAAKRQLEDRGYLPHCLNMVGEIELTLGRTERARECFAEVLRDFAEFPHEAFKAMAGLAQADWLAGHIEAAARGFEEVREGLAREDDPIDKAEILDRLVRFERERGAEPSSLRALAGLLARTPREDLSPLARRSLGTVLAMLAAAEGRADEARLLFNAALELSLSLGSPEWTWRIHRDLAALEPESSPERAASLAAVAAVVREQARRIRQDELRRAYLAHRERAALLVRAPEPPLSPGDHPPVTR